MTLLTLLVISVKEVLFCDNKCAGVRDESVAQCHDGLRAQVSITIPTSIAHSTGISLHQNFRSTPIRRVWPLIATVSSSRRQWPTPISKIFRLSRCRQF